MLGSLLGAAGSIFGGLLGASQASKDRAFQKKFAQNGIQWRAADARKAGIHPLAALGASTPSYTPVGDGGLGSAIAQGTAALGDAVNSGTAKKNDPVTQSQLEVNRAQTDLLKAQTVSTLANVRAGSQGAVGGKVALPNPSDKAIPFIYNGVEGKPAYVPVYDSRNGKAELLGWQVNPDFYGDALERTMPLIMNPVEQTVLTPGPSGRPVDILPRKGVSRGDRVKYKGDTYEFHPRFGWKKVVR